MIWEYFDQSKVPLKVKPRPCLGLSKDVSYLLFGPGEGKSYKIKVGCHEKNLKNFTLERDFIKLISALWQTQFDSWTLQTFRAHNFAAHWPARKYGTFF